MLKDEIIQKYHKEKDEGKIFFSQKALLKSYGVMAIIAAFVIIMSFLLTGESTIPDIVFILILPYIFIIYGTRAFYLKNKLYIFISLLWFFTFCIKVIDFINEFL